MASSHSTQPRNDLRRSQRFPTDLAASVIAHRETFPIRVKDISALGICFRGNVNAQRGDEIMISLKNLRAVATVVWSKDDIFGATFHKEISPLQIVRDNSDHSMFSRRRSANSMIGLIR